MVMFEPEFSVDCRVCGGQFFQSVTGADRCENCQSCLVCQEFVPEDVEQKFDSLCSAECGTDLESQLHALAKRVERNARRRGSNYSGRAEIFERDNWTCHLCGYGIDRELLWPASGSPVLDHVVPRVKGGADSADNLKAAHALCNNRKRDMDLEVYLERELLAGRGKSNFDSLAVQLA